MIERDAGPQPITNPDVNYHVEALMEDPDSGVVVIEIYGQTGEPNAVIRVDDEGIMASMGDMLWTAAVDLMHVKQHGLRDLLDFKKQEPVPVDDELTLEDILSAGEIAQTELEFRKEHGYDPRDREDEEIDGDDGNS